MSELETWLKKIGLEKYFGVFRDNEVEFADISTLSEEDFIELGIPLGPRRRMKSALKSQRMSPEHSESGATDLRADEGERRQVTVLFTDLAGFTKLSTKLDAEELHALLNRYFEVADRIVKRFGGTIDKHIGDSVMAVFGAPVAHTNDPERAVRAARDINAAMPELSEAVGHQLAVHSGIASGQVVASGTGSKEHREYTVTGEAVNLASRLDSLAEPGEVLISNEVRDSIAGLFACEKHGDLKVDGFTHPVQVWRLGTSDHHSAGEQRHELIGRRSELRQFQSLLNGCQDDREGCTLLVRGDPGVGKTRLVAEFEKLALEKDCQTVRCLVLDFGVTRGEDAISNLALQLLDFTPQARSENRLQLLQSAIEEDRLTTDNAIFAKDLLGLRLDPREQSLFDEMETSTRDEGRYAVLSELLAAKLQKSPVVIVVEDIHWADTRTLAYLSHLVEEIRGKAIMLVLTSRVEGASTKETWRSMMAAAPLTIIELQPLRTDEAIQLAESLGYKRTKKIEKLIVRSAGNPLFLDLLMRNSGDDSEGAIPESLQGLILARVDQLGKKDREALQAGSVVGQRVSLELLRTLLNDPDYNCLQLVEQRLMKLEGDAYLFDHALIRDGVYSSILRVRRYQLHQQVADWYASRDPSLYAKHLDLANDQRAAQAYLQAARDQVFHHGYETALEHLERAMELDQISELEFSAFCLQGEIRELQNLFEASLEAFKSAQRAADGAQQLCSALMGQALALLRLDRHVEAETLINEAEDLAGANHLESEQALIHRRRATIEFARGDNEATFRESEAALAMAEKHNLRMLMAEALSCMADAEAATGKFVSARNYYNKCIEICREDGFHRFAIINAKMLGDNAFYRGELPDSRESFEQVVADAAALGDLRSEALARHMLVYLDCLFGDYEAALDQAELVHDQILEIEIRRFLMNNYCLKSMAMRGLHRTKSALHQLDKAENLAAELDVVWAMPWVWGERALTSEKRADRLRSLDQGAALLAAGHGGYFTFEFYRPAIEAALQLEDWGRVERLCTDFAQTMGNESVGLPEFVIRRAKAISASGLNGNQNNELDELHIQAEKIGLIVDLAAIEDAMVPANDIRD